MIVAAENHLLRRQFRQAQATSRSALERLQPPPTPFITKPSPTKKFSIVSLRPFPEKGTVTSSTAAHLNQLVRLCAVWMQATAELQHEESNNKEDNNIGGKEKDSTTTTTTTTSTAVPDLTFIPSIIQFNLPSNPTLPYLTSIIWLTFLAKVGALEQAKECILNYLCSSEGRLYSQAHWRAVTASMGQTPSAENARNAQSRYEHLIEILILDILIPLGEDETALDFLNKDISLSAERRQSLWCIVRDEWQHSSDNSDNSDNSDSDNRKETIEDGGEMKSKVVRTGMNGSSDKRDIGESALEKLYKKKRSPVEEQGLTNEDVEVLWLSAAAVVTLGVAGWFAWRKRSALAVRFRSISGFLS
jgi:hypothetical protein